MELIDSQALATVRGGFGAILGALLQAAPGIMQGVSGIISASKSGGGSQHRSHHAFLIAARENLSHCESWRAIG